MGKVSSSKDLMMLLLYARGAKGESCEPVRGRTRLMKMVFLFDKEVRRKFNMVNIIPDEVIPTFIPYDFGPFSDQVFSDLEFLVDMEFVRVQRMGEAEPEEDLEYDYWQAGATPQDEQQQSAGEVEFSLTNLGREFVDEGHAGTLTPQQWSILEEFKRRSTSVPLRALLKYVYEKYPEMTKESKIRDEILASAES